MANLFHKLWRGGKTLTRKRGRSRDRDDIKNYVRTQGFEIVEKRYSTAYLGRYGFNIATLIDVGVYQGTPAIYDLFKSARLLLVDPMPGAQELAATALLGRNYTFVAAAAGAAEGTAELHVDGNYSSIEKRLGRAAANSVKVDVRTLDAIVAEHGLSKPFGLKVDTEGYDLDVMKGATATLRDCEFVLVETNVRRRFEGAYRFSDMILTMRQNGFEAAELITPVHHNRFADVLFVRESHPSLEVGAVEVRRF
jgi:FkbM family methyltransferase